MCIDVYTAFHLLTYGHSVSNATAYIDQHFKSGVLKLTLFYSDLLLMGAWTNVLHTVKADPLPVR